jgi:DnaJ like chaperone protein
MSWKGKVFGTMLGFFMGGPVGAILGATLGHQLDKENSDESVGIEDFLRTRNKQQVQTAFFKTTFAVMGHVAKADGVVSKEEIWLATRVMDEMRLSDLQRKEAIELFDEGKKEHFPLQQTLASFCRECDNRKSLRFMLLEIQFQVAYCDGDLNLKEEQLLAEIANHLGITSFEYQRIKMQFQARQRFEQQKKQWQQSYTHYQNLSQLDSAYQTLGLKATATESEIKTAYRRLIRQHHPDKLEALNLSEERMNQEKEKAQKIIKAYDIIKSVRKF